MSPEVVVLTVLAAAFAVINGTNDGGTLVANGLKVSSLRPLTATLLILTGIVIVPFVLGTGVATTLVTRLVAFEGRSGQVGLAAALLAATLVTFLLSRRGLPTSLTLALIGGITGSGLGGGLPISWETVGTVLLMAALAPVVGALIAYGLTWLSAVMPSRFEAGEAVGQAHRIGFTLQCIAYGANDGQKMLAVFAIAAGQASGTVEPTLGLLLTIAGLFFVGLLIGLPRIATVISGGVLSTRPYDSVTAELASATAVLGSAALGAPVSMTQAITGGLVGVATRTGLGRIRWEVVFRVVVAWVLTLPLTVAAAALITGALRSLPL